MHTYLLSVYDFKTRCNCSNNGDFGLSNTFFYFEVSIPGEWNVRLVFFLLSMIFFNAPMTF